MRIEIDRFECIGGMRPLDGASPFDSASLVARDKLQADRIVRIGRYEDPEHAHGEPLTPEEWQSLCDSEHAHSFPRPVPLQFGARMWLLSRSFEFRDAALAELRNSGVILDTMYDARTDIHLLIVRENDANPLRDEWAEKAYQRSMEEAHHERWDRALTLAEQAWVLGRGPVPKHWALLTLCYERVGRAKRAQGMIQVARRSHGEAMANDLRSWMSAIEAKLSESRPGIRPAAPNGRPSSRIAWRTDAREHNNQTLKRLGSPPKKEAA